MSAQNIIERLERASGPDRCWEWPRSTDDRGRGRIWVNGKIMLAHRAVWEFLRGPIPAGKMLCHHCDNAGCVNPGHMYVGTHADNMRDMAERKRAHFAQKPDRGRAVGRALGGSNTWSKGEGNGRAKLTADQARAIRESADSMRSLARRFGISDRTVKRIKVGEIWKN